MIKQRIVPVFLAFHLVLGTWKGYIALFREGCEEPRQIFPTPVASLPDTDRAALEKGIVVRSEQKLQQLLEDYLS